MEWDHDTSLRLIDEYEKAPILWDSKHPYYYSKTKKQEAWDMVATKLNTDVDELKKKLNSLLGSFRRERSKHRRHVNQGKEYVSKWFAYESMKFLLDIREDRDDVEMLTSLSCPEIEMENDEETEIFIGSPGSPSLITSAAETSVSLRNGSYKRVKMEEEKYTPVSGVNDRAAYMNNSGYDYGFDEFDALGKIVAVKVRHMPVSQRIVAEKLINDILYHGQLENLSSSSSIQLNNDTS